jgi:hypothetical protein
MRHVFVSDVVKELLGPRGGAEETFIESDEPRNEYSTGQLFPTNSGGDRNPDEEESVGTGAAGGEEDSDEGTTSFVNQALIDAGQNFRRVPSSMGISFVVCRIPNDGEIEICVTWGRYERVEGRGWVRKPKYWIASITKETLESGERCEDSSLQLSYKLTPINNGQLKLSIYVSSLIAGDGSRRPQSEDIIFQPEIRVRLKDRTILRELGDLGFLTDDPEWRVSTRQYDRLKVFARGHLCGVYWDEIDPQRPFDKPVTPEPDVPFRWIDGQFFLKSDKRIEGFITPHLRTDFIPMYPAPASGAGDIDLDAQKIADCANYDQLSKIIEPLLSAYESWVNTLRPEPSTQEIDASIVTRHREAIRRIRQGMSFLKENPDALLSFLFMNKVMAKQYAWGKKPSDATMKWRPFQIAFILLCLESSVKKNEDRGLCDTIWFPTGGGKTEAYLGLAAFVLAYRRRTSATDGDGSRSGDGTAVISRYTLRLLTIQQFRRAMKMVMACEVLRCTDATSEGTGWLPPGRKREPGHIWGHSPFSLGLWVGGAVTPNQMRGAGFRDFAPGAINLLTRPAQSDESDPAQILNCPCCNSTLSFPLDDVPAGPFLLKLHASGQGRSDERALASASTNKFRVVSITNVPHPSGRSTYLKIELVLNSSVTRLDIDRWWTETGENALGVRLNSFGVARPGYIPVAGGRRGAINDYEIRCPEPQCELNSLTFKQKLPDRSGQWVFAAGHPCFVLPTDPTSTKGLRIPALTVDEKLYGKPPSMLISTVDKFARLAFTNEAASLFGRIRSFDPGVNGGFSQEPPNRNRPAMNFFEPPGLIIQDELHLLDGPLGSTFGLFETAIEKLCASPKYIASSATIRNSVEQVFCLTGRKSVVFPPVGLDISEGFFLKSNEVHPLDESSSGRMFLGLAFPGRAPQTPTLRLWGRLLQTAKNLRDEIERLPEDSDRHDRIRALDHFWTLVGYFNAVRELAQGETLIRQDIPQFLDKLLRQNPGTNKRQDLLEGFRNLSSQTSSSELPGILAKMERGLPDGDPLNAVASTSMFGTGVDVARLSLMVVHGQPKSASQYIQAVGRIGRRRAGLATIFFRVSKPRDLNHYEYFTGYHRKLPVAVEPITVKPLAPKAVDRAMGSVLSILVRNWRQATPQVPAGIDAEEGGAFAADISEELLAELTAVFRAKWEAQPERRRNNREAFLRFVQSQVERWQEYARRQRENGQDLQYTKGNVVVLGQGNGGASVFPNVSQSLREVEPMINLIPERD